jgi:hypothetical protein
MKRPTSRSFVTSLILTSCQFLGLMAFSSRENAAHAYKRYASCDSAINASAQKLNSFRNISLVKTRVKESSYTVDEGRPQDRTKDVVYGLTGKGVAAVMTSAKTLATLSDDILRNCSDVATVTIAVDSTDWWHTFGILSNKVRSFECHRIDPRRQIDTRLPYGKTRCL